MIHDPPFEIRRPSRVRAAFLGAVLLSSAVAVHAQTVATDAWVRGTVAQQKATGMFVTLTSATGGRLVGASSPAAGVVEIHEMSMDGNVMRMRAMPSVALPAGQAIVLKPGGVHVMLMDLRAPLAAGQTVPVTLTVEGPDGRREALEVKAVVRALGTTPVAADPHAGHRH